MSESTGGDIRVMVVDDHPMWRDAVERDLREAGLEVVAVAGNGREALERVGVAEPDVMVLDLQIPSPNGIEVTAAVTKRTPRVAILVLSASGESADVLAAVKAGALGYLVKSAAREELVRAVRLVADGVPVFTPELAGMVLGEFPSIVGTSTPGVIEQPRLTARESEVLTMVAQGMAYRQIADRLVLSHRTVQNHVQNILGKLQMNNRVQLTRYAIDQGLDAER